MITRSDGWVSIRPPVAGDAARLVDGRDDEFRRWLGPGAEVPAPEACIVVDGSVVGWVDYDLDHPWLGPGEVNVGYFVFASHRGRGVARRALALLLEHLAAETDHRVATLLIDPGNAASLAVAAAAGFEPQAGVDGKLGFFRLVGR